MLKMPSKQYAPFFHHFYLPQRIAQLVISSSLQDKHLTYDRFVSTILPRVDSYGQSFGEGDITLAVGFVPYNCVFYSTITSLAPFSL